MDELWLWRQKVAQYFHDPVFKPWASSSGWKTLLEWLEREGEMLPAGLSLVAPSAEDEDEVVTPAYPSPPPGHPVLFDRSPEDEPVADDAGLPSWVKRKNHAVLGDVLGNRFVGQRIGWYPEKNADLAAAGADRPVLGRATAVRVPFAPIHGGRAIVTHPLAPAHLCVIPDDADSRAWESVQRSLRPALVLLREVSCRLGEWQDAGALSKAWIRLWRRIPTLLTRENGILWPTIPADTRCPDHSLWDHLKVTTALAWIQSGPTADVRRKKTDRLPVLLSLWVGPVRQYLEHGKSARDLWTGSLMVSELAWAMAEPIVEAYGPDALVYPDLRENLRGDLWLNEFAPGAVPGGSAFGRPQPLRTRAALIPNRIVALVPEGGEGSLPSIRILEERCRERVRMRWRQMVSSTRAWLGQQVGTNGAWTAIWERQLAVAPEVFSVALPWIRDPAYSAASAGNPFVMPSAFPFGRPDESPVPSERQSEIERNREERFRDWIDRDTWNHYQATRLTFLETEPRYTTHERGFDYALAHHQLLVLHRSRRLLGSRDEAPVHEPGEKCTLCGRRQALTNLVRNEATVSEARRAARDFWSNETLDPEGRGAERLCGFCALRRYLTETIDAVAKADRDPVGKLWEDGDEERRPGARVAVPFPSLGAIAHQVSLAELATACSKDAAIEDAASGLLKLTDARKGVRTQFPRTLPRLRRAERAAGRVGARLLQLDVQFLDPETWRSPSLDAAPDATSPTGSRIAEAAARLRRVARDNAGIRFADTQVAVVSLDGDRTGRLLLGDRDRITATWRDVLHPDAVRRIEEDGDPGSKRPASKIAWRNLLDRPRLVGPSLHAFISRCLASFANRILPWVVEREFGGFVFYAGGDDALFVCPADDALGILRRLDQLYRTPWIWDRHAEACAWGEDEDSLPGPGSPEARNRFVPLRSKGEVIDFSAGAEGVPHPDPEGGREAGIVIVDPGRDREGALLPMLGPGHSFSAGVAYGHFKTSLHALRQEASNNLASAKRILGPRSAAIGWLTRSGSKIRAVLPFAEDRMGGLRSLDELRRGLDNDDAPNRVPYKLRQMLYEARAVALPPAGKPSPEPEVALAMITALVRRALDQGLDAEDDAGAGATTKRGLADTIARLWWTGIEVYSRSDPATRKWESTLDPVLLARRLGRL